jgi:hypothetical protein
MIILTILASVFISATSEPITRNREPVDSRALAVHLDSASLFFAQDYRLRPPEMKVIHDLVCIARESDTKRISEAIDNYRTRERNNIHRQGILDGELFRIILSLVFDTGERFPYPFVIRSNESLGIDYYLSWPLPRGVISDRSISVGLDDLRSNVRHYKRRDLTPYSAAVALFD